MLREIVALHPIAEHLEIEDLRRHGELVVYQLAGQRSWNLGESSFAVGIARGVVGHAPHFLFCFDDAVVQLDLDMPGYVASPDGFRKVITVDPFLEPVEVENAGRNAEAVEDQFAVTWNRRDAHCHALANRTRGGRPRFLYSTPFAADGLISADI